MIFGKTNAAAVAPPHRLGRVSSVSRRGFLGLLAGVAATATLHPERLLWVSGKKLISIPVSDARAIDRITREQEFMIAAFRAEIYVRNSYLGDGLQDTPVYLDYPISTTHIRTQPGAGERTAATVFPS